MATKPLEEKDEEDKRKETPAQNKFQTQIDSEEKKLFSLMELKEIDLGGGMFSLTTQIKETKDRIKRLKQNLRRSKNLQKAQIKHRTLRKQREEKLKIDHPEFAQSLRLRDTPGRPRIECDNSGNSYYWLCMWRQEKGGYLQDCQDPGSTNCCPSQSWICC